MDEVGEPMIRLLARRLNREWSRHVFERAQMQRVLARIASFALATALVSGLTLGGAVAQTKKLKDVTYLIITTIIDGTLVPYGVLAKQKGWFEDEGLNVTLQTVATGGQALQLALADQAQITFLAPDQLILASLNGPTGVKMFYPLVRKQIFGALVKDDSKIQSYCDLEGKTVGFPSFSVSMQAYVATRMEECKKPPNTVKRVESGFGVSSAQALETASIDAFVGYPTLFVGYENAGYKFRRLAPADWQTGYYGTGFAAKTKYMAENPDVIEKFSRVLVKSALYVKANPEDSVRALWKANTQIAPKTSADVEAYMKRDLAVLKESLNIMRVDEFPSDFAWGSQDAATWQRHIDKLKETGQLPNTFNPDPNEYFTDQFSKAGNNFDHNAFVAEAQKLR